MAKVIDTLIGTLNGKIGGLVYYQVDGQTYVRKAPPKHTKKQKENVSPLKKLSQDKMAMTQKYLKPLTKVIAFGYQEFKSGARRPYHACVSYTKSNCFVPDQNGFTIDPSLFKITRGSLFPPEDPSVEKVENGLLFKWKNNAWRSSAKPWDKSIVVLHNPTEQKVFWDFEGSSRESESFFLPLTEPAFQETWNVYLAFSQELDWNKKMILCDSVFLGTV